VSRPRGWRRLFRIGPFRRDALQDLDDELDFHFQEAVGRLTEQGRTREEALREARRRFGDVSRYRRELHRIDRGRMMREGWTMWVADRVGDARRSLRSLARQPGFTAAVVLTFALGIGANAALFGIVDRLVLEPPAHIQDPESVVTLTVERSFLGRMRTTSTMAWDDFNDFEAARGFSGVAAYTPQSLTLGEGQGVQRVQAMLTTAGMFPLLGVHAHAGRFYGEDDDRFGAPLVAVLGYDLWHARYGGDSGVVGRTIHLAGTPYTVVGVAPKGFTGVRLNRVDVWLPLRPAKVAIDGGDRWFSGRGYYFLRVVARLATDVTRTQVADEATRLHRAGREESIREDGYPADARIRTEPLVNVAGPDAPPEGRVSLWLAGVSLLVLLIACANVANLLLARGVRQWRESAVRLALGISPMRLVEQRVLDSLILALGGGAVGLAVARWGGAWLRSTLLPQVDWSALDQTRVLWFALGVSVLAGLLAGAAPAALAARQRLVGALSAGGRGSTLGKRLRGLLTVGQAALAAVLLVGAGLFVLSLRAARDTDLGFDADRLVDVRLEASGELSGEEETALYRTALERVSALPGVVSAAVSSVPFGWSFSWDLGAEGLDSIPPNPEGGPYYHLVSADYFETMGIAVLQGRALRADDFGGPPVAVINGRMAELLWPGRQALGRCLYVGSDDPPCTRVVGITEYAHRNGVVEEEAPQYYLPLEDGEGGHAGVLFVRVSGDAAAEAGVLARGLLTGLPGVRFVQARPLRALMASEFRGWRLGSTIFSLFGILALLVAAVGLYSLLAFDVAERRREIGIRLALGASGGRIRGNVLSRAMGLAFVGVALGTAMAWLLAPYASDLLFQVSPRSPEVFAVAALVLLVAAAAAGVLPARRAIRVEPTEALRTE
jgi:predicted permease